MAAVLVGCGGGDGSKPSMSLSTNQITVTVASSDPAPRSTVTVTVANPPPAAVYVGYHATTNGIDAVQLNGTKASSATILISFKTPALLGAGTYNDTLLLAVCNDKLCSSQVANSPQTVSIAYTVTDAGVVLASISPASAVVGSPGFTLIAYGSGFAPTSVVQWNGSDRPTTYKAPNQLSAQIASTDVGTPGTATVTVSNAAAGGGVSTGVPFAIQPPAPPGLVALYPSSAVAGGPGFTLTVSGSGFVPTSAIQWNGSNRPTTYVPPAQLTAQIAATDIASAGTATVTVSNAASGGGASNAMSFTIQPPAPPGLGSVYPPSAVAGGPGFTLYANGSGFVPTSVVQWNGSNRPTTYVSPYQLTAQIVATDISIAGTATVTVSNAASGGGTSNGQPFAIQTAGPLALGAIYPASVVAGGSSFVLDVVGTGFAVSSMVMWNGVALPTTYVSSTELTATVAAADITTVGAVSISVQNTAETSPALTLAVVTASKEAVSFRISPSHSGVIDFSSVSFPTASRWSVNLGGAPSYALIASGKVFVTVSLPGATPVSGASQLVALDQATGATVWGPISINGVAATAYDAGTVFVLGRATDWWPLLQAFDAGSGSLRWSTVITSQYWFSSPPTAANGLVYVGGAGVGGRLYAVDAANGAIVWTQPVWGGDPSSPAVTADGLYVTYPCQTYDFRLGTGTSVWHSDTGCEGGGGATPVAANGVLYAPNGFGTYNGMTFDAESGAQLGSYVADNPPAIGAQTGYFLQAGTLRGIALGTGTVLWSFAGDGKLVTSPIGVNQYVIVGSSAGNLYALDGATGAQVWAVNVGAAMLPGAGWAARIPYSDLAAGAGLLVVPAGNALTAFTLSPNP